MIESADPEERECYDDESQITEIFVHESYLSYEDIRVAETFDVSLFVINDNDTNICLLVDTLKRKYPDEE